MSRHAEPNRPSRAAGSAALLLLCAAAFLPVLANDFLTLDDPALVIRQADRMGEPLAGVLRWAFTDTSACNWFPLTRLSHALDYRLHGLDPRGHHLTNLLLHGANAALLFLLLAGMTGAAGRSFLVAALFAVHPIQVESVAWVAERSNLLFGLFWLLAIAAYHRYTLRPSTARYLAVAATFAAGLMAKPMMVTLPLVLLVLDCWPLRRFPGVGVRRLAAEKAPLLALSAIHAAATLAIQGSCGAMLTLAELGPVARAANAPLNYARYLAKALWPANLSPLYLHPGEARLAASLGAAAALAVVTALAWRLRRGRPAFLAGWLWFLVVLFPVIGLLQAGGQPNADRFAYVALVGLLVAAAFSLLPVPPTPRAGRAAAAAVAALVALLAVLTNLQSRLWKDSPTLLGHVLRLEPGHAEARHMLAASHFDRMEHEEAVLQLLILVATRPEWAIPRANLSLALEARGDLEAAIHHLRAAIARAPEEASYGVRLARLEGLRGAALAAVAACESRVRADGRDAEARRELGAALFELGRFAEAAAQFEAALALEPGRPDVAALLARARDHRAIAAEEELRRGERPEDAPFPPGGRPR